MQPGENRWVAVKLQTTGLPAGQSAYITVDEMAGNVALNGFGVGVRSVPLRLAVRQTLLLYREAALRLAEGFHVENSAADREMKTDMQPGAFVRFVHNRLLPHIKSDLDQLGGSDSLGLSRLLAAANAQKSPSELANAVTTLLNAVDAHLTMRQLEKGDPADILQMVRWQKRLFQRQPKLAELSCSAEVVKASSAFLAGREEGKLTNRDYPKLLAEVSQCLHEAAGMQGELASSDLATLEREHRAYLQTLSNRYAVMDARSTAGKQ